MITDNQYRRLMKLSQTENKLGVAAAKAGMDEKTARKWRRVGHLPANRENRVNIGPGWIPLPGFGER